GPMILPTQTRADRIVSLCRRHEPHHLAEGDILDVEGNGEEVIRPDLVADPDRAWVDPGVRRPGQDLFGEKPVHVPVQWQLVEGSASGVGPRCCARALPRAVDGYALIAQLASPPARRRAGG